MKIGKVFEILEKYGVDSVIVDMHGGGDEGGVDSVECYDKDKKEIKALSDLDEGTMKRDHRELLDAVETIEEFVECRFEELMGCGPMMGGTVTWNVPEKVITADYTIDEPVEYNDTVDWESEDEDRDEDDEEDAEVSA